MSTAKRNFKRIDAHRELRQAGELLKKAGDRLIKASQALKLLEEARKHLARAQEIAKPSVVEGLDRKGEPVKIPKHDGLPAPIRGKIQTLAKRFDALVDEVKKTPITPEDKALAQRERKRGKG